MEFWTVVGDADRRKSATIRSLTGAFGTKPEWELEVGGVNRLAYVATGAPQEGTGLSPAKVISEVTSTKSTHLLIALRHRGTSIGPFDADKYVAAFIAAGWKLNGILILSPEPTPAPLASKYPSSIDYAPLLTWPPAPSNAIANVVRSKWGL